MFSKQEAIKHMTDLRCFDDNILKKVIPNDMYCEGKPYSNFLCDMCESKYNVSQFVYSKPSVAHYKYDDISYYECDYFTYYVLFMWFVEHIMKNEDLDSYLQIGVAYVCGDRCYIETDIDKYKKIMSDKDNAQIMMIKCIVEKYCELEKDSFSEKLCPISIKYNGICIVDDYTVAITKVPNFFSPAENIRFTYRFYV